MDGGQLISAAHEDNLDPRSRRMNQRDHFVEALYQKLLEIEQRLIPTGLHVLGRAPAVNNFVDILCAVASFDRPELGIQSLHSLVATGLGLADDPSVYKQGSSSQQQVEALVKAGIKRFLAMPADDSAVDSAVEFFRREAAVPTEQSARLFRLLQRIRVQLAANHELDALAAALRGEYIEPGPGADIVQNPEILPTGRNTHAVNPYNIPSLWAFQKSEAVVTALLDRFRREQGRFPQTIAMVLWGMDNIKSQGEGVAQALWLLGVRPRRDAMNRVVDVDVIPLSQLGRPRIDVVMTVSGIFRDLFASTMNLLDKAVRTVVALDEPLEMNFPKQHVVAQVQQGDSYEDSMIRVFSNAAGSYGTNVDFMVLESQWESARELGDLFVTRKSFAYGHGLEGRPARELMDRALARVELTYQNIDSYEVGLTDVDHYFEYLGGVTQAVEQRSGTRPRVLLCDGLTTQPKIRSLEETLKLETRTKTLNPKWYEGMLQHGYSGVAQIERHVSNTFGWSATARAVEDWVYDEISSTFLQDQTMLNRLRQLNPHSTHNLVGRLLEAHGRGLWQTAPQVIEELRHIYRQIEDELEGVSSRYWTVESTH